MSSSRRAGSHATGNATETMSRSHLTLASLDPELRQPQPDILIARSFAQSVNQEALLQPSVFPLSIFLRTRLFFANLQILKLLYIKNAADSKLIAILKENLETADDNIVMTDIDRRYWSDTVGHDYIQRLVFSADLQSMQLSLEGNDFAVCCFAAVMRYIEMGLSTTFAAHSLRVRFEPSEGSMMIDFPTISSLELIQNSQSAKSKDCLYGLLNETQTSMGARCLRSNILQPATDEVKVASRHEALHELVTKEDTFLAVRGEALKEMIVDTDRVLAKLVVMSTKIDLYQMEQSVNHVVMLKTFVDGIKPIWQALTGVLCNPENFSNVEALIRYALNESITYSNKPAELCNQRVFAIRAGMNEFLDVARKTYQEVKEDINDYMDRLKEHHDMVLDLKYNPARQYFFKFSISELDGKPLPQEFINVCRQKGQIECQTLDLLKMNQKLKDSHNEVISMSDKSVQDLIENVRLHVHPLFKISEAIALLDMLAAFAQVATTYDYIRPEITDTIAVKAGRHPIRDKIQKEKYIPNDVYADAPHRFQIITGCNMSGKSTYIRSIALMCVMNQIGCFVPAEYASLPLVSQLFARVSTDDSVEANMSTFASEMREMAFILGNVTPHSLVIVDELGRGTSTTDGLAIAIAIAEALIESNAFTWFVTHFRDLPCILAERAGVVNLHLAVDIAEDFSQMTMMYKIAEGYEEQKFYGLALARVIGLPAGVMDVAVELSHALNERVAERRCGVKEIAVARRRKLVLSLRQQLKQARDSNMDPKALRVWLKRLQDEFTIRMSAIDADSDNHVPAADALETPPGRSGVQSERLPTALTATPRLQSAQIQITHPTRSQVIVKAEPLSPETSGATTAARVDRPRFRIGAALIKSETGAHGDLAEDPIVIDDE